MDNRDVENQPNATNRQGGAKNEQGGGQGPQGVAKDLKEKAREHDLGKEFEALKKDLAQVRRDLRNLADAGVGTAGETAGATRERLESEVRQIVDRLRDVSSSAMDGEWEMLDDVRRRVGDHPVTAIATALGLGFVVGWLATRK